MRNHRPPSLWARAAAALAMVCYAVAVSAEARMEVFDVPEQQAITGIPEFARQADIQILVPAGDVRGVRTSEVIGNFTIRDGLQKLLSGTNLAVGSSDNQTVTLKALDLEHAGAAGSSSTGPVVVAQAAPTGPATPAAPRAQSSAVSEGGLEEIVVTATRRETNVSNTPISITALSSAEIERDRIVTMDDIAIAVPGFVYMPQSASETYLSIRGTSTIDDSTGTDQGVNMFIDDVVRTSIADLQPDLYDMDRIEVLKGPQGTLFGRNSLGGTISMYTKNPTFTEEGSAEVSYGENDLIEAKGMYNEPINDVLAARFVISSHSNAGYLADPVTNTDIGKLDRISGRAKLLFAPSEQLKIVAGFDYQTERGDAPVWADLNFAPHLEPAFVTDPNETSQADPGERNQDIWGLNTRADLTESYGTWTSISGYRHLDVLDRTLETGDPLDTLTLQTVELDRQFTEELRLASPSEQRLSWVSGLYYQNLDKGRPINGKLNILNCGAVCNGPAGFGCGPICTDPITGAPLELPPAYYAANQNTRTISYAGFLDATFAVTDSFKIDLGGRYTDESKSGYANLNHSNHFFGPAIAGDFSGSWTAFTPKLTLTYKPVEALMTYATVSKGFQSGGFNTQGGDLTSLTLPFSSEIVWNYEVGEKFDGLNHRVQANVSVFTDRYSQLQIITNVTSPSGYFTATSNAGAATVSGLEMDIQTAPANWLTVGIRYDYITSKFTDYVINNGDGTFTNDNGNEVPFISRNSVTGLFDLHSALPNGNGRVAFGGDISYRSSYYITAQNAGDTPAYVTDLTAWHGLINLHASWKSQSGQHEVALFAQNLSNIHYGTVPADLSVFVETGPEDNFGAGGVDRLFNMRPGPPQSIGITFREKF
jgi:iron complex outermembrane receptor protein